jgi:hypothetical protein
MPPKKQTDNFRNKYRQHHAGVHMRFATIKYIVISLLRTAAGRGRYLFLKSSIVSVEKNCFQLI